MAVSPCTVWCSMDARAATSHTSPGSLRSATHAQRLFPATASAKGVGRPVPLPPDTRLHGRPFPATAWAEGGQCNGPPSSAGTLVHVLEPPVKDGVNPVRMRSGFMSWSTKSCQDAPLLAVGRNGILVRGFGGQIPPT